MSLDLELLSFYSFLINVTISVVTTLKIHVFFEYWCSYVSTFLRVCFVFVFLLRAIYFLFKSECMCMWK